MKEVRKLKMECKKEKNEDSCKKYEEIKKEWKNKKED
jgi:hypothetical protein